MRTGSTWPACGSQGTTRTGGLPSNCFPTFQALGMADAVSSTEFTAYETDELCIR